VTSDEFADMPIIDIDLYLKASQEELPDSVKLEC